MPGYQHLLRVLANPRHKEYEEMREWAGEGYDPGAFDAEKVSERLQRLRW